MAQEDIGKLPDNSIGESIARLPGVTAQRLNGRANVISIRGFGPDFSQTLLNGREQTSLGDARAVEFDQYPAEVVSQVVVYKTPSASLVGQGLVGTVDIRTIRPLEYGKQVFAVGARGSYTDLGKLNAGSKEFGYRANATYVDQFADDTIGIALSASYIDEPYQVQEFNAWGYNTVNGNNVIGGSKSYVTSTQLTRFGLTGTLQFKPTDTITLTADGFYSDFHDDQTKRGIELPLAFDGQNGLSVTDPANNGSRFDPATATASDGLYTSGTFTNVEGVIRNDVFERDAKLYSGGFNALYEGDDGWSAFFDFGYSRTDRHELSLESYSGTGYGRGNGATDTIGFETGTEGTFFDPALNYSNPGLVFLTDPLGWGGSTIQAGYSNDRIVKDELKQYRVQVQREMDGFISAVKVGMNYTDRDKSLTPEESFVLIPGGATEAPIPSQYIVGSTDLTYLGLGPILSYDPRELLANGVLELRPNSVPDVIAKAYTISEDLMTLYGQADIRVPLGTTELTGNFGVQAIGTSQKSSGLTIPNGVFVPVTRGDDYWDVLPSINLSLRFDSGFVIRAAAAREVMRPRLDDLRVAIAYGVTTTVDGQSPTGLYPYLSGSGGNPYLRPYRANAFDLNFEKYFGSSGVIALQLFYKDIKSYVDKSKVPFDFTGFPLPTGQAPATLTGLVDQPANTGSGELYGAELAATVPFDLFTRALDGFGVTGGVGYTETKVLNLLGDETQIPGYSKWVANGTLFFEKYGLNLRGSARYRTGFLGDFTGFGGSPTRRIAKDELIIDAQIGYDFGGSLDGLSVYIQGQNLTDEPFVSLNPGGDPRQVIDYQSFGRRFLAGFTYKF
ncbi:TonB-dependent receptor [Erythrobacter sp. 3-20A1M]|uniref:TonB-dependent receptor n=1 Tax=Erythrobacter sp. 3-20A1M TaxID=2653850 RepID=UPI00203D7F42|nr:TonB-dependent receptor [Erythrobacter sp. 3-20A1M]